MAIAVVTNSGLERRLGEKVCVTKRFKDREGKLVHYSNRYARFAVLGQNGDLAPISLGNRVKLKVNAGKRKSHYRGHMYVGLTSSSRDPNWSGKI